MTDAGERVSGLHDRISRMTRDPTAVGGRLARLVGPVYRLFGWRARFATDKVTLLLDALRVPPAEPKVEGRSDEDDTLVEAMDELEANVERAERACTVHGYIPVAHASWFFRVAEVLAGVAELGAEGGPEARRVLAHLDPTRILPPLSIDPRVARPDSPAQRSDAPPQGDDQAESEHTRAARLIELQLAAIDHVIEAARGEQRFIDRRRRLLEGARRLLLDATAALPLEPEGVARRQQHVSSEITRLDRLEAAGLTPTVALSFQAKQALRRGDRERLYAALVALDGFALGRGDRAVSGAAGRALDGLLGGAGRFTERAEGLCTHGESLAISAKQIFGDSFVERVRELRGGERARRLALPPGGEDPELHALALQYLAPGTEDAAMRALVAVDGAVEVGAALSPVRAVEIEERARLVEWPTQEMLLVHATEPADLVHAVVDDPRAVVMNLAAGQLLTRKFVQREGVPVERTRLVGEVRIYLLDASTSMLIHGSQQTRARLRDAIMMAELSTMMRRYEASGRKARLTLYYRYFTKVLDRLVRVQTPAEMLAAMGDVVATTRKGGTDIQGALLSSFETIRDAKRSDPELGRASIVLVTDGEAPVDPEALRIAREETRDVPTLVSVIALGEENNVLRDLVARQRARGERAFYQYLTDDRLVELCRGVVGRGAPLHARFTGKADPQRLTAELEDVLVELEDLERSAQRPRSGSDVVPEGPLALEEVASRDRVSLERRYQRWFPEPTASAAPAELADSADLAAELDATLVVLATVSEIVGELGGDGLSRKADAIDIVERLLPDAQLSPDRFRHLALSGATSTNDALAAVHVAVSSAGASFDQRLRASRSVTRAPHTGR